MLSIDLTNRRLGAMCFDVAYPKKNYETGGQKVVDNDDLVWNVSVLLRQSDSKRTENIIMTIPDLSYPGELFESFEPVAFAGLCLLIDKNTQGR